MTVCTLAVTGLKREARAMASAQIRVVVSGGNASTLTRRLDAALAQRRVVGVISVGLAGALSSDLEVGDWVVGDRIVARDLSWRTDASWTAEIHARLSPPTVIPDGGADPGPRTERPALGPGPSLRARRDDSPRTFVRGDIAGSDRMVVTAADKATLYRATSALAVDMESHVAAKFAADYGLPFAALRVISDTAGRDLPRAVLAGMRPDGGMNLAGVLSSLARDPRQLPDLIRTGRDAEVAFRRLALLGGDHLLCGPGIGCPYLGQLLLDVT